MIHRFISAMRAASGGVVQFGPDFERTQDGRIIARAGCGPLRVVLDADPERAGEPRLCNYAAECGGEAISGRDEWDVAVRVVAAWAGERRGAWAKP